MDNKVLTIDYYSDLLCVWAWIAQRRVDELNSSFGDRITMRYHYINVFGDTASKITTQWSDRQGYDGFAAHVKEAAAHFESAPVNPAVWHQVRPATSANGHLLLKAIQLAEGVKSSSDFALILRRAFFVDALDVGNLKVLDQLLVDNGHNKDEIHAIVNSGAAMGALMGDYQRAKELAIKGSPCYVMNDGRQTLFGNVGYRVLHANIDELLANPADEASWC